MTRREIVERVARERRVEKFIMNVARASRLAPDLEDLAQMVYLALLTYDADKIVDLWEHDELGYFIARIILNQYRSVDSPWRDTFHRHGIHYTDITEYIDKI